MKKINFLKQLPKQSQKGTSGNNAGKSNINQSPANQSPTYSSPAAQNAAAGAVDMNAQVQQLAQQLADQIVADQQQVNILSNSGKTFSRFNAVEDIVDKQTQIVTAGLWSDNQGLLDTFYSSSAQTNSQRRYYVDVLQKSPQLTGSAVQFACAFGHAEAC